MFEFKSSQFNHELFQSNLHKKEVFWTKAPSVVYPIKMREKFVRNAIALEEKKLEAKLESSA